MLSWILVLFGTARASVKSRSQLALENLALRQQLAMFRYSVKRPRATFGDRLFWILYAKYVGGWRALLYTLHPDTVVRWHRECIRRYWALKSRSRRPGRPTIDRELRNLIRTMQFTNPCWGAPRIHGELLKLGIAISQSTVSKYMIRGRNPPSQTWRTFLSNHASEIAAIDFLALRGNVWVNSELDQV
jgi:putative transposase